MILQRSGNDFRSRSRTAIDQHHHGELGDKVALCSVVAAILVRIASADRDDLAPVDEVVAYGNCLVDQTARIVAKVEHQAYKLLPSLAFDFRNRLLNPTLRLLGKLGDT